MTFTVASNSFKDGDYLPSDFILSSDFGFGCAGRNRSPHLKWSGAPEGTKSFAVTCYDPDAPTGSGFWHWLLVNIPANVSELAEGAGSTGGKLPAGALQTRTDFGVPGYGGPCPPEGDQSLPPFRYQHQGNLATIGRRAAVVELGHIQLRGFIGWVFWSAVHIYFLIGLRNRFVVAITWLWSYVTFKRGARLITEVPTVPVE
jgi:Raf kinase inhibitor-like YbhB/YbcL family protein